MRKIHDGNFWIRGTLMGFLRVSVNVPKYLPGFTYMHFLKISIINSEQKQRWYVDWNPILNTNLIPGYYEWFLCSICIFWKFPLYTLSENNGDMLIEIPSLIHIYYQVTMNDFFVLYNRLWMWSSFKVNIIRPGPFWTNM